MKRSRTPTRWRPPRVGRPSSSSALDAFGKIDIVVNNAGILRDKSLPQHDPGPRGRRDRRPPSRRVLRHPAGVGAHARAAVRTCRSSPRRRPASSGTSVRPTTAPPRWGWSASRTSWRRRASAHNIKANVVAPTAGTRMTREIFGDELADKLAPGLVSPVVAWLAHEDCPVSGHTYSVGGGRVARVFVGEGPGYVRTDAPLTLEDVRDHFDEIERTDDFTLFKNATDELRVGREPAGLNRGARMTTTTDTDTGDVTADVTAWLHENWDPDLTVAEWWDRLGRSGWATPTWPVEWYGRGLSRVGGRPGAADHRNLRCARCARWSRHVARGPDDHRARDRRATRAVPPRHRHRPHRRGASCSASPAPGRTSPGSTPAPSSTVTNGS